MELVCNLAWLAVAIVLWSDWFARKRRAKCGSLLPAIGLQLVALCALTAILLPVISITDDLQSANNPAEVERGAAKRNLLLGSQSHSVPGAIALMVPHLRPCSLRRLAILPLDFSAPAQGSTHYTARWSRSPPKA